MSIRCRFGRGPRPVTSLRIASGPIGPALLAAIALLAGSGPVFAQSTWHQSAGPGAVGTNVLYRNGAEVLAGTDGEGVYHSTDNGATWRPANGGLAGLSIQTLAANSSFLFAGVAPDGFGHGGVYRSSDDGADWTPAVTGIEGRTILCLFTDGPRVYAGDSINGVYKSTDNGQSWVLSNNGMGSTPVRAMTKSSNSLFAIGDGFTWRSTNNGATWTSVPPLNNLSFFSLVSDGSILYAGGLGDVARSTDGGNTWSFASLGFPSPSRVPALAFDGNRVYAGTDVSPGLGVYTSTNQGVSWFPSNAGIEIVSVNSLATVPGHVLAGMPQKSVFASSNNGVTWAASASGLPPGGDIRKLVYDGGGMIAATGGNGCLRSTDGGVSWVRIDEADGGQLKNEIVFSVAVTPAALFAATASSGIYRSTNGGAHWTQADNGLPADERRITDLITTGPTMVAGTGRSGIFYSSDGGGSWQPSNAPAGSVAALASSGSGFTYALLSTGAGSTTGIYRSSDGGQGWSMIFQTGSRTPISIAADGSLVYVGDLLNGMMRSTDDGIDWTDISPAPNVGIYSILPHATDLYAGAQAASSEVYKTSDRGGDWTSFNDGLESNTAVGALASDNVLLWAGTDHRAVWVRQIQDPARVQAMGPAAGPHAFPFEMTAAGPFSRSTQIRFRLPAAAEVHLDLFDVSGREVARLIDQPLDAGSYSRRVEIGAIPSGVYFARLDAGGRTAIRRLVAIR